MAILQRVALYSNERLDTPDGRAIEAYSQNDWRLFISGAISDTSLTLTGFDIVGYDQVFTTPGFKVKLSNVVLFHPTGTDQASGFYVFAGTEPDQSVALSPSSTNYVECSLTTVSGTPDVRAFWDQGANGGAGGEFSDTVNTVINLELSISSNISGFTAGNIPLYKIVTNVSGIATSITDCREMFFRLGTGGSSPNPSANFVFPSLPNAAHARLETPTTATSFSTGNAPWQGGDKNLKNFKDWMDVVMTSIKEMKGVPYWYMTGGSASVPSAYANAAMVLMTGGTWQHSASMVGHLSLTGGASIRRLGLANAPLVAAFTDIDLTAHPALFVILPTTDTAVTYGFGQNGSSPIVVKQVSASSATTITVATGGNYVTGAGSILAHGQEFSYTSYTAGTGVFSGVSPDPSGLIVAGDNVYQLHSGATGYIHHSAYADVPNLASDGSSEGVERTLWLAVYDGSGEIFVRNAELEQGEQIQVGDETPLTLLAYIGAPNDAITTPSYATSATDTKTLQTNYNATAGENLTIRAAKLTSMMADKAQDKTVGLLPTGFTFIVNTTSGPNQNITFTGGGTLNVAVPSSANIGTIGLTGTLTLGVNQVAYFQIDRNAAFSVATLAGLTVSGISSCPLDEKTFIFAYRGSGTSVYAWDGSELPVGTTPTVASTFLTTRQDRSLKLVRGGNWHWNLGTGNLSFDADAFVQIPGLPENRNRIPFGTQSPINLSADGTVAYVEVNRSTGAAADLTVLTTSISSLVVTDTTYIVARRLGSSLIVGEDTLIQDAETHVLGGGGGSGLFKDEGITVDSSVTTVDVVGDGIACTSVSPGVVRITVDLTRILVDVNGDVVTSGGDIVTDP